MKNVASRLIPICAAASVAILANAPVQAQQTYTLRFNHVLGPSEPYHKGFQQWAERVKERTNGLYAGIGAALCGGGGRDDCAHLDSASHLMASQSDFRWLTAWHRDSVLEWDHFRRKHIQN
jgi:hypothetical protein